MHQSGLRTAAAVVVLTALVCVVAVAGDGPIRDEPEPYVPNRGELVETGVISADFPVEGALPPEVFSIEPDGPGPPAWLWWLLGTIAAAGFVWVAAPFMRELIRLRWQLPRLSVWRWRRRRAGTSEPPDLEPGRVANDGEAGVAQQAVHAALAPLREPADPRAAVIESYARLESVLAARELGRRNPEAPREYLRRVMHKQGIPDAPLLTLTALFEEARFSRHPIPESAARRAEAELETARAALAATSTAVPT
jgi:Domain of unknown function (DUF4129)